MLFSPFFFRNPSCAANLIPMLCILYSPRSRKNSKRAPGDAVDEDQETPVEMQEEARQAKQVAHKKHAVAANMWPPVQKIVPGRPKETRCALFIYRT